MAGLDSNCSRFPPLSCSCYRTEVHPVLITRPSLSPATRGGLPPVPQLARERERAKAPSCNDMSLTLIEFEDIRVPSARPSRPFGPCSLNNFKRQVKRKGGGQKGEKKAKTLFFFLFLCRRLCCLIGSYRVRQRGRWRCPTELGNEEKRIQKQLNQVLALISHRMFFIMSVPGLHLFVRRPVLGRDTTVSLCRPCLSYNSAGSIRPSMRGERSSRTPWPELLSCRFIFL